MGEDKTTISLQEALTMQLDEMELLETAYPEVVFDTPDARPLLRQLLDESLERQQSKTLSDQQTEERRLEDALATAPLLSFRCPLPHKEAQLRIRLPRLYPDSPLKATVEGTPQLTLAARNAIADTASDEATRISGELRKEPQCLQVLGETMRKAADVADHECVGGQDQAIPGEGLIDSTGGRGGSVASSISSSPLVYPSGGGKIVARHGNISSNGDGGKSSSNTSTGGPSTAQSVLMGRRLIYSHHIIATQKRTGIVKAARELRLGGFSKVGWPGVIVVEGEETSCEAFVGTLRGWRWKHLAVRGEETVPIPDGRTLDQERLLPLPLEELGEKEGVSALAKRCREASLGELFSTLLR